MTLSTLRQPVWPHSARQYAAMLDEIIAAVRRDPLLTCTEIECDATGHPHLLRQVILAVQHNDQPMMSITLRMSRVPACLEMVITMGSGDNAANKKIRALDVNDLPRRLGAFLRVIEKAKASVRKKVNLPALPG